MTRIFEAGRITTSFIEERPQLLTARSSADRGTKIVNYLADVTVNKPHGERSSAVYPHDKLPDIDLSMAPPAGSKQCLAELGREGFAAWLRESRGVGVTDTTFRDAHQSLLATRIRTSGLVRVVPYIARIDAAVAVDRVLGWGDLRCGVAVFEGGPVGAADGAAGSPAQHLPADAAARTQYRRLHALSGHRHIGVRG